MDIDLKQSGFDYIVIMIILINVYIQVMLVKVIQLEWSDDEFLNCKDTLSYKEVITVQVISLDMEHIAVFFLINGRLLRSKNGACKILELPSKNGMDDIGIFIYQVNREAVPTKVSFKSDKITRDHKQFIQLFHQKKK